MKDGDPTLHVRGDAVFVDDLTGRMLDRLEQLGMLDEVMIVVVSDHGENFEAGEPRGRESWIHGTIEVSEVT